ncbi:phage major capsid protein [Ruminococcus sp.]|uniref:phage major capsid protein n=1 Tax=Ruminococcus sp. TaxID=41978 RepID=UPI0025D053DB|nr:phage major capsid protein [Ruminococcus sp.]
MTIQELREKRAKAWDTARDFLDSKRNASGLLSEEDSKTYDTLEHTIVDLGKEIERMERAERIGQELSAATTTPVVGTPGAHITDTPKHSTGTEEYSKAFWNSVRNRNWIDVRNDLKIGEDTEGGYLVPDEFEKKLIEALEEENVFRPLATRIQTSSGDRKIPVVTSKGEAVWMEEEEAYTLSDDSFGQLSLSAYKVGTAIKISEELLNDSVFDLPAYIAKEFARRIGAKEEEAFVAGDGVGKPTGIFAASGGAQEGATSSGAAISFDDMIELFYSIKSPYRKKAVWLLNEQTVKALRKIKDNTGNYIWQPSVSNGIPDTILNRPYVTSVYAPTIEAGSKAIAFGDFSYYWIADRQGRSMKRLNELFAMNGQIGFLASQRVDGKLILPEAVKVLTMKA